MDNGRRSSPSDVDRRPLEYEARVTIDSLIKEGSYPSLPDDMNRAGDSRDTNRISPRVVVKASFVERGEKQAEDFVFVEEEPEVEISDLMINSVQYDITMSNQKLKDMLEIKAHQTRGIQAQGHADKLHVSQPPFQHRGGGHAGPRGRGGRFGSMGGRHGVDFWKEKGKEDEASTMYKQDTYHTWNWKEKGVLNNTTSTKEPNAH
ncbi:hypothetical protein U1Q18_026167 [Sarracenia purpurea var. burkii]